FFLALPGSGRPFFPGANRRLPRDAAPCRSGNVPVTGATTRHAGHDWTGAVWGSRVVASIGSVPVGRVLPRMAGLLRECPPAPACGGCLPLISLRRPGPRGGTRLADPGGGLWAHARAFPLPRDEVRDGNCAVRAFRTRLRCLAPAARPHGPRDCPESVSSRDAVGCGTRIRPGYRRQAAAAPISPSVISEIWIRGPDSCV